MRVIVIGYGIQGKKRREHCGNDFVWYVEPSIPHATYKSVVDVPLDMYDAACVCTPNKCKYEIIDYLVSNKKHVLVEKPMWTEDNSKLKRLQTTADNYKAVLYTAYNHRFEPAIVELKRILDARKLGLIYSCRIFYGNGTAKLVKGSQWRDSGIGIFGEIGSHLLDTVKFIFNDHSISAKLITFGAYENNTPDCIMFHYLDNTGFITECEATYLSWKNTFTIDVIGEEGSAHVNGLCKWGKSTCEWRERVYPSGVPVSHEVSWTMPDPTWKSEFDYFKGLCEGNNYLHTEAINDLNINYLINKMVEESR